MWSQLTSQVLENLQGRKASQEQEEKEEQTVQSKAVLQNVQPEEKTGAAAHPLNTKRVLLALALPDGINEGFFLGVKDSVW